MNNIVLLVAWGFTKNRFNEYFAPYTHWVYIDFIAQHFDNVYIISTVKRDDDVSNLNSLISYKNVQVVDIPYQGSQLKSLKNVFKYYKAIKLVKDKSSKFYCRIPDPFVWMPRLLFRKQCIMHYVGDSLEAAKVNEKWSILKKTIMILGYLPDYFLTLLATRSSVAFSNGRQIAEKLQKYKLNVMPVISSTILDSEIPVKLHPLNDKDSSVHLVFTGYLRYWKGINTLFDLIRLLKNDNVNFTFDILGDGDMYADFMQFVKQEKVEEQVKLHGHVNDRSFMNSIYRNSDIYVFPSLGGEGSPRSVVEAMAQGLIVISTPVGSLPTTFKDREDIRFAKFNDASSFYLIIKEFLQKRSDFELQRVNALKKIRQYYTRDIFLGKIFMTNNS